YQVPVVDLIAVQTKDPFKVLVATILSARTKDEVTAKASERLFGRGDSVEKLAGLDAAILEKLIYPVGFYKNKAKYLTQLPEKLAADFDSRVPETMEGLLSLPGVGRKTANLVLAQAFGVPAICVDTHVHRIMNIWGYVKTKTPEQTEMALRKKLPEKYWIRINSLLVAFGQGTCRPMAPHCDRCVLADLCPKIGVTPRKLKKTSKKGEVLRLVSWNVNGLRAVYKKGFMESLQEMAPDVLALQEIKAMEEQLPKELQNLDGYHAYFYSAERKGYSGVATYSRREPEQVIRGIGDGRFDSEGRVLTLEFPGYYFINCYFPNSKGDLSRLDFKHDFNVALQTFAEELAREKSVVVCGDFNVAHKEIDLANPRQNENNAGFTPEERSWMESFTGAGWVDSFRLKNKEPEQYSWWSYRSRARDRNIGWRIDYLCVDRRSRAKIIDADIYQHIHGSDHCPVVLDFLK
ncbi:MAG: exodeoxyribonuclease III, partial [Thermodesulfobacteriota bacterium]